MTDRQTDNSLVTVTLEVPALADGEADRGAVAVEAAVISGGVGGTLQAT